MTHRRVFPPYCRAVAVALFLSLACTCIPSLAAQEGDAKTAAEPPAFDVQLDTVHKEFDGTFCWFHPRVGVIPKGGRDGKPAVVMTLQKWLLSADDFFSALSDLRTDDLGASWTGPREHKELGWRKIGENSVEGVCDFTPGWHAPSGKLLAVGHTVRYKNDNLMAEPVPASPAIPSTMRLSAATTPSSTGPPIPTAFFSSTPGAGPTTTTSSAIARPSSSPGSIRRSLSSCAPPNGS